MQGCQGGSIGLLCLLVAAETSSVAGSISGYRATLTCTYRSCEGCPGSGGVIIRVQQIWPDTLGHRLMLAILRIWS